MTFETWMNLVDQELVKLCTLTHLDLPDQTWRDWFDEDLTPREAAEQCLENENMEELLD